MADNNKKPSLAEQAYDRALRDALNEVMSRPDYSHFHFRAAAIGCCVGIATWPLTGPIGGVVGLVLSGAFYPKLRSIKFITEETEKNAKLYKSLGLD